VLLIICLLAVALVVFVVRGRAFAGRKAHRAAPAHQHHSVPKPREPLLVWPAVVHRRVPLAAAAAIVVDGRNGRVLWARKADERRAIASTTKIMTALLALRQLGPRSIVRVPSDAPRVPLVREGLRTGERVQAWKLFYGLLLYSGNDDALSLAVATAGTRRNFIAEMNAEVRTLGLTQTHFASTSGVIDDDNYSSAGDLAALTRVAMRNPRFRAIVRRQRIEVPWSAPTYSKIYVNKNRLLELYPGANGVKTGYTERSGPCIVASAQRHEKWVLAVVLNSRNEYADAERLLDLGFAAVRKEHRSP
jgi:serine-type D-Ala-D-Ala carboxypeptidase (penicillin-binding protein 5/6)